ncbi:uncharacterized protein [Amphiura filiformis]|uniref:uncharacterized protein n=1 Tax=Amphiura filiformis TaxID=82378 RepID=UPI003B227273
MLSNGLSPNKLMMNDSKTEFIPIRSRFAKIPAMPPLAVGATSVEISDIARNLGVAMDGHLSMCTNVNNICKSATIAIRKIGQIRPCLDQHTTERLVHAFITSRLDSCNSLLYSLPDSQIMKLQWVQNTAARLVAKVRKYDSVSLVLDELHWLTV